MFRLSLFALLLMLAGCAAMAPRPQVVLPTLHLAPAALGQELAVQQQLLFTFGSHERELVALLEVDATEVRLAVEAMGQSGVRLLWDGSTLEERRAPWLPPQLRSARVLDDLQFVHWPVAAIRAVLPSGWELEADEDSRRLVSAGHTWLSAQYVPGQVTLDNAADGYRLRIRSAGGAR